MSGSYPYGVEFSPKSSKLYVTTTGYRPTKEGVEFSGSSIFQFDLSQPNISSTKTEIHHSPRLGGGALQLAINGKIYRSKFDVQANSGLPSLGAIEKPDRLGDAANYKNDAINLMSGSTSEQGLPPFISQLFLLSFDYEFNCEGEETHFYMTTDDVFDSLIWDFGDGNTSTEIDAYHEYASPGEYEVTLTAILEGIPDRIYKKNVEIHATVGVPQAPYELIECDIDLHKDDGITTFNLSYANDPISLGNEENADVYYYKDLRTLVNDTLNENSLPLLYTNTEPDEMLYAKVILKTSDCYSVGELILKTSQTDEFKAEKLYGCDLGDGRAEFDLDSHKSSVLALLSLPEDAKVTYHARSDMAATGYEPLTGIYMSKPKSIFIRVSHENICQGIGEVELEIKEAPFSNSDEIINICDQDLPLRIDAGVSQEVRAEYTYEWMNGGNTHELEVDDYGEYYVTITDNSTLCSSVRSIRVNPIPAPQVERIELNEEYSSTTATVVLSNEGNFEYALNDENGQYQEEPVFYNLDGGTHSVFIRDLNNCTSVERSFFIFGFPRFFTPNNDGYNDVWEVKGLNPLEFTYTEIKIYNRFGKLLASIPADSYWDGIYNGNLLPADDYWFKVGVTDQNKQTTYYTRNFSLIVE
jgi:gliding motility-associated-like protein